MSFGDPTSADPDHYLSQYGRLFSPAEFLLEGAAAGAAWRAALPAPPKLPAPKLPAPKPVAAPRPVAPKLAAPAPAPAPESRDVSWIPDQRTLYIVLVFVVFVMLVMITMRPPPPTIVVQVVNREPEKEKPEVLAAS